MNTYLIGTDCLGAQSLVIQVKDPGAVVRSQGGAAGGLAFTLAPKTIEDKMYAEMASEMIKEFRARGIDIDARAISDVPVGVKQPTEFIPGVAVGAAGAGLVFGLFHLIKALVRKG